MMNDKKGFTLVECAVAIALVGIIILAAFSTVVYVAKSQDKYDRYFLAQNKLECLLTCFKSGDFESSAELLTGCPVPEDKIFYYAADGVISTEKSYS
ncbi:MAG: prepilin-type N-terminal cleavage/methylation domain-containing protein, partial [Clostridia bacterium]|nr:prepilin-type N-terminal cleavage/methylation domain-containing protein [Clostridia bacterium]